jgi:NAD(P)-dependent dehydrogenase (short-subunit alcohol dehydrogenase family)
MAFEKLDNLNGQVAVITGAMGDMGFATAQRLAQLGARVVGIVRKDLDQAQEKFDTLPNPHLGHFVELASVVDSVAMLKAVWDIKERAGGCDILINTAGISKGIPHVNLDALTDDLFDEIMKVNVRGTFSTIKLFTPMLKESKNGLIVNISSAAGLRSGGSNIAYAASKAAMDSMTRNLARALAPTIRVVSIAPSAVDTKFLSNRSKDFLDSQAKLTPLGRIGTVDDVANTIEALATTMRFVTGNCIVIDGGRTI